MTSPLELRFLRSASDHGQLPQADFEMAIAGRSNVGKSSLINALANRNKLARTSKTPGATQLLNVYEYGSEDSGQWLVDLPGYGYAKISKAKQAEMAAMINDYVIERESLAMMIVLIDANVGPTELDVQTIDWLRHIELEFFVVGTKVDKIKASKRGATQRKGADKLGIKSGDVSWVSSEKGTGITELRARITDIFA